MIPVEREKTNLAVAEIIYHDEPENKSIISRFFNYIVSGTFCSLVCRKSRFSKNILKSAKIPEDEFTLEEER